MMFAMLLETLLFIMRTNPHELKGKPKEPEIQRTTAAKTPSHQSKEPLARAPLAQNGSALTLPSSASRQGEVTGSVASAAASEAKKDR